MTVAWDKTVPADTIIVSQLPSVIRADKTHLENCLEAEHDFVDDNSPSFGRHKEITLPSTVAFWMNVPVGAIQVTLNFPIVNPTTAKPVLAILPNWNTSVFVDEPTQGTDSWEVVVHFSNAAGSNAKISVVAFYAR